MGELTAGMAGAAAELFRLFELFLEPSMARVGRPPFSLCWGDSSGEAGALEVEALERRELMERLVRLEGMSDAASLDAAGELAVSGGDSMPREPIEESEGRPRREPREEDTLLCADWSGLVGLGAAPGVFDAEPFPSGKSRVGMWGGGWGGGGGG